MIGPFTAKEQALPHFRDVILDLAERKQETERPKRHIPYREPPFSKNIFPERRKELREGKERQIIL